MVGHNNYMKSTKAKLSKSVKILEDHCDLLMELIMRKHYKNVSHSRLCGVLRRRRVDGPRDSKDAKSSEVPAKVIPSIDMSRKPVMHIVPGSIIPITAEAESVTASVPPVAAELSV